MFQEDKLILLRGQSKCKDHVAANFQENKMEEVYSSSLFIRLSLIKKLRKKSKN